MDFITVGSDCCQGLSGSILWTKSKHTQLCKKQNMNKRQCKQTFKFLQTLHHSQLNCYLVLLAGGSRGLDQLLENPQTHESDVLHHYRCLHIHWHEEQTEGCGEQKHATLLDAVNRDWEWKVTSSNWVRGGQKISLTTTQAQLPASSLFWNGVCQQQHLILQIAHLLGKQDITFISKIKILFVLRLSAQPNAANRQLLIR